RSQEHGDVRPRVFRMEGARHAQQAPEQALSRERHVQRARRGRAGADVSPGWLPRPFARVRKRTLAYTRVRRARPKAERENSRDASRPRVHHEIVIFDPGPAEFPVATLMPHDTRTWAGVLLGDLRRWLVARWTWLRPRTVPVVVAALGATFVIASAEYLSHGHGTLPTPPSQHVSSTLLAP